MAVTAGEAKRHRQPPGPRGNVLLGSAREMQRDVVQALMDGWREFGDVVHFRLADQHIYLVAHPDDVKYVLQENYKNYPKVPSVDNKFKDVSGEGLLNSSGDFWLRQRRIAQPVFHRQRIAAFATHMTDSTAAMLERWRGVAQRGETVDMRIEMQRLSLDILARALFMVDLKEEADVIGNAVTVEFEHTFRRLQSVIDIPLDWPLPGNRRFKKERAKLDEIVYRLIAERRRSGAVGTDLVSQLMQARDEETGESMSDQQLRDEVMTMIFAGHETVSTAMTWVWAFLSKHGEVERRLRAELTEVLGGRIPTLDDIPRLTYTTMVIQETLRHYPPIWLMSRTPVVDDEIGGYLIPKNSKTLVFICPYVTHRHPDFWENPEGFDPQRFTPENAAGRHRFAYFPFGGGPRLCIGEPFGMLEMQLVIGMVAQAFRPSTVPGHVVQAQPAISLRAKYGLVMNLKQLIEPPMEQGSGLPLSAAAASDRR
jgi:cytochrome P450